MKLSARECNRNLVSFKIITVILLIMVVFTACVSQKPKLAAQNNGLLESTTAKADEVQADTSTKDGTQSETGEKQPETAVLPADNNQEKPELIAVYKKPPLQKELIVVLFNPPMPQSVTTGALATQQSQVEPAQQALVPVTIPVQQPGLPVPNQQGQKQGGQTQATQTAPAQGTQNQSAQNAQNAQTGTVPPVAQKPAQTAAASGLTGTTGTTATNSGNSTTTVNTVQPAIPFAPASGSAAFTAAPNTPVPAKELVVEKNKPFTITLDGNGWIYLGDEYNRQGIRYESRQLIDNQIVYRLNGDRIGEFLLRFQRDNPVTQLPETQYIKVTVNDVFKPDIGAGTQGGQPAPKTTQATEAGTTGNATAAPSGTVNTVPVGSSSAVIPSIGTVPSGSTNIAGITPGSTPGPTPGNTQGNVTGTQAAAVTRDMLQAMTDASAVLEIARTQLAQKQIALVLGALDRYLVLYPAGSDEVLYLYALAYEQDTPYRDIQKAYTYYKQLVREYPLSVYRQYALERITYLERFYPGLR